MKREDIHLEVTRPDWAFHADNEKMVIVHFPRSAEKLMSDIADGKHDDLIDQLFDFDGATMSATLRNEHMGFTLYDLADGKSRLDLHVIPTPEGDDILDGSHHQEDLSLTDMMNVVAAVKTFMGLLK